MRSKNCLKQFIVLCALVQAAFFSLSARAGNVCSDLFTPGGVAVELEMAISNAVLQILTTTDGTVGGLFPNAKLPVYFVEWADNVMRGQDPRSIAWDMLDDEMKVNLIQEVSRKKKIDFFKDRKIPNLKVKEVIRLKFDEETQFFGQTYPAGVHDIDLSRYFGRVEYMSAKDTKVFKSVEMHLISKDMAAGQLIRDAWTLQKGIGANQTHLHQHIVVPIPLASLERVPNVTSFSITEYYRRINLLSEFHGVLKKDRIWSRRKKTWLPTTPVFYFDSAYPEYFSTIFSYFSHGFNHGQKLWDRLKFGWVGFRGADFYDQPNLYGFEYRAIDGPAEAPLHEKILNNVQAGMRSEDYGFSEESVSRWLEHNQIHTIEDMNSHLEGSWYKHPYREILRRLPPYIQPIVGQGPVARFFKIASMKWNAQGNQAVKMLLHNWESDFLFFEDPAGQKKVREAQIEALKQYFGYGRDLKEVAADFVAASGLLDKVAASFKLQATDFPVHR